MTFKDNRLFIAALEKSGDVVRIKDEIDWEGEAGAMVRRAMERKAQAIVFEKLKDYPPGYRIFGGPLATHRRLAIALGLKPETSVPDIQHFYEQRIESPIKPMLVSKGPCQENIVTGDDVDLFNFPVPLIHWGDGGRYIGSWHAVIMQDPDSSWVNWGMYRQMVYRRNIVVGAWHIHNQGGMLLWSKYLSVGKPMPVAIAIGIEPVSALVAVAPFNAGQSEVDYAGALLGRPVELVKCQTSDLMVPANAEIVIEGEIDPNIRIPEAPFGEYTGYRTAMVPRGVGCRVKAVTFRNKPIITMDNPGQPSDSSGICWSMTTAVANKKLLRQQSIPVVDVNYPPEGSNMMAIVSLKRMYANLAMQVHHVIQGGAEWAPKVIVTDDDVNIFDMDEVLHTLGTRCHPERGVRVFEGESGNALHPFLTPKERYWGKGASVLFDCSWPYDWSRKTDIPPRVSFKEVYPEELQKKVLKNWKKYGFEQESKA